MREDYIDKITVSLNNNRTKNLSDFDNHPSNVAKLKAINELKKELKTQQHALKAEAQHISERDSIQRSLDNHENNVLTQVITAFGTDYCLNCQDVYDKILTENQQTEV